MVIDELPAKADVRHSIRTRFQTECNTHAHRSLCFWFLFYFSSVLQPDKLYFLSRPIHNTVKYDDNNQILILTSEEIRGFMRRGTNVSNRFDCCSDSIR